MVRFDPEPPYNGPVDRRIPSSIVRDPIAIRIYEALLPILDGLGEYWVQEERTSLNLAAGRAPFLGVHPHRKGIRFNLVLARPIYGERLGKVEQVSKNCYHNQVDVASPEGLDRELIGWIREAYALQVAGPART